MRRFASLRSRLVVTAVALVAVVSLLIATVATLAIRSSLYDRLDDQVTSAGDRLGRGDGDRDGVLDRDGDGDGRYPPPDNQGPGAVNAQIGSVFGSGGYVLRESGGRRDLSTAVLRELAQVEADNEVHEVELTSLGTYRVTAFTTPDGTIVSGLPTHEVEETVTSLIGYEVLLILLGVVTAAGLGSVLVRRQLRPLTEVAETAHTVAALPLSSGEIALSERVPGHLTDEATEVGQVGSALNTLLDHVESALGARHRSELQVRQFVADASHELRTPLATIVGYTELARRRPGDAEATRAALGKVEEESHRMTALVEDLLLLARLDAGRPLETEPIDLTRLLLEAVSDARVLSPGHRWRLELPAGAHDADPDDAGSGAEDDEAPVPVEVPGDEQRLHQVVTNLLTNARKYTPEGTTVTITVRPDGFEVRDDGPGFPPDLVAHAFERFARGDTARTREGGAGLGLALVEAIVEAHGGLVTLASEPGDTRIVVTLPRATAPAGPVPAVTGA